MDVLTTVPAMRSAARAAKAAGRSIGFVPTMGSLHEGHLSLMRLARQRADVLVASIFVNPLQFGPNEDLGRYPRALAQDTAMCEFCGVDYLFCPAAADMYAPDRSVFVDEISLSQGLCGASRAGHFRGVLTVVAKLFNLVMPDVAVFGQKDAQQAAVIKRMVRDLNYGIEIVVAPIVREPDGLAMSSRNTYLAPEDRSQALWLSRTLGHAVAAAAQGVDASQSLDGAMRALLAQNAPGVAVEYIAIVDGETLKPVDRVRSGTLIAIAAKVGKTRLIDNVVLE